MYTVGFACAKAQGLAYKCHMPADPQPQFYPSRRAPRRWNYFKDRLIERFGELVYKVGIDAGFDCPNRDGSKARGGCAYCSQLGSLSPHQEPNLEIPAQIIRGQAFVKKRYGAEKCIVYFQAFTNTYAPVEVLRRRYDAALGSPGVVGLSIATRPDCIDPERAALLGEYARKLDYFTVELGLQSAYQNRLDWVNRQETVEDFHRAMELLNKEGVKVITHVILGFPGETLQDMQDTVMLADRLGSAGIKLQMLHVIKKTKLAWIYQKDPFELFSLEEYGNVVIHMIERLSPEIEIHRITGETDVEQLVAPEWTRHKTRFFDWFERELEARNTWQGRMYVETRRT
jgi:radical SAM protein (TIGR01212 family)